MIDPMPRQDLKLPPMIGTVSRADYDALVAEVTRLTGEAEMRQAEYEGLDALLRDTTACAEAEGSALRAGMAGECELREAAKAVIARWDTPLWKDVGPTADVINRLRTALTAPPAGEGGK